jgi:hypothetical protein
VQERFHTLLLRQDLETEGFGTCLISLKTLKILFPLKKTSVVLLSLAYNSCNEEVAVVMEECLRDAAKGNEPLDVAVGGQGPVLIP